MSTEQQTNLLVPASSNPPNTVQEKPYTPPTPPPPPQEQGHDVDTNPPRENNIRQYQPSDALTAVSAMTFLITTLQIMLGAPILVRTLMMDDPERKAGMLTAIAFVCVLSAVIMTLIWGTAYVLHMVHIAITKKQETLNNGVIIAGAGSAALSVILDIGTLVFIGG